MLHQNMSHSSADIFAITEVLHWCLQLHNLNCLVTMLSNDQIHHQLNIIIQRAILLLLSKQSKFSPGKSTYFTGFKINSSMLSSSETRCPRAIQ